MAHKKPLVINTSSKSLIPREHESECVESLDYDVENQQLTVVFNERGSYTYFDVPPDVFAEFNAASLRGSYFNLYIRGKFEYERIA